MKKIFVMEYWADYTGGGCVAIAEDIGELRTLLKSIKSNPGLSLITDKDEVNAFKFCSLPAPVDGMEEKEFLALMEKIFPSGFEKCFPSFPLSRLEKESTYPGFFWRKAVRLDWFGIDPEEGLYIVFKTDVSDFVRSGIISDTYYCA